MNVRGAAILGALLGALAAGSPARAHEPPDASAGAPVRQAAAEAIRTLGLQPNLPHDPVEVPPDTHWHVNLPDWLVWGLAVAMAGVLAYALRDLFPGFISGNDDAWASGAGDRFGAARRPGEDRLALADELAGQGQFVEAMHVLLLHCLADIRRRLVVEFPDSLTSREILRSARLPEAGRRALDRIVARVELTYFGDRPAGWVDYESCRAHATELAAALEGGRTA